MKTGVGALTDDEARFVEIYGRFARPIQAYCARRTPGSQVADAVSDIFLVAWRRIDPDPGRGRGPALALRRCLPGALSSVAAHVRSRKLIERLRGLAEVEDYAPEVLLVRSEELVDAVFFTNFERRIRRTRGLVATK